MNIIHVVRNVKIRVPGLPVRQFITGEEVSPGSRYYFPLLWSGNATDSGIPAPDPNEGEIIPELMYTAGNTAVTGDVGVFDETTGLWMPIPSSSLGSGEGGGPVTWGTILEKPSVFPPDAHDHPWSEVTDKPAAYPPSTHNHPWSEVTDKPASYPPSTHTHGWNEVTDKPASYPPSTHQHGADDITSGVLGTARLGTGTADGTTYLRGDGTWQTPPGGSSTPVAPNIQAGTAYTFVLADNTRTVIGTNAAATTFTIPTNAAVPFPIGSKLPVIQRGIGQITMAPASGVVRHISSSAATRTQNSKIGAEKIGTDEWVIYGDTQ